MSASVFRLELFLRQNLGFPFLLAIGIGFGCVLMTGLADQQTREARRLNEVLFDRQDAFTRTRRESQQPVRIERADAFLAARTEITTVLDELHRLAGLLKLELPQAQYGLIAATEKEPAFYEIVLPLKARYASVKPFVMMALNSLPALAIRELSFRRPIAEVPELDVTIRFVLFLRDESP